MRWLGFDWGEHLYHASDYFEQLYDWAVQLIAGGQGVRRRPVGRRDPRVPRHAHRAGPEQPVPRPRRSRRTSTCSRACARASSRTARACCARRSTWPRRNINLRDPVLYRILHATHPRTGDAWCIYPTYDFAHGQSDAIEGITHSICTLEFEDHRPLYDWLLENLPVPSRPRQYEFARLNLTYTVLSKRFLLRLVNEGHVRGWDDPRMPTISGLRRRGFPAEAHPRLRGADRRGQGATAVIEYGARALRARRAEPHVAAADGGARPAQGRHHELPRRPGRGRSTSSTTPRTRRPARARSPFSRELWIERDDFMEDPPKKFFRLAPGREVRLRVGLLRHLPGGREGRGGRGRRAALHLRPRDARRRRARRPLAQGDAALGLGRARGAGRGAPLRPPVRSARSRAPTGDLLDDLNPASEEILSGCRFEPRPRRTARRARASSSSASATSAWIRTRRTRGPCGTAWSPCATAGRR